MTTVSLSHDPSFQVDSALEPLFGVAGGFMASQYLFVASELQLFVFLAEGPADAAELARRVGIPAARVEILLSALTALGLLEYCDGRFANSAAAAFLSGAGPWDLRPLLRFWRRMTYPLWMRLEPGLRTGATPVQVTLSEADQRVYSEGVEALSLPQALALPHRYDFNRHRRVLDVGGGTGMWLRALVDAHPHLSGTLFDLPGAAAIARARRAPRADGRVDVIAGDLFRDPLPQGYDAILVANVVHGFSPERNLEMLRRIRRAVRGDTRLLLVDFWTDATHTSPRLCALLAGTFLLNTGEGRSYSVAEVVPWLGAAGWVVEGDVSLPNASGVIVARAVVEGEE